MTAEHTIRVAQLVPRTHTEGPGCRFAIWTQGCPLRCPGCCNPEMLAEEGGELWAVPRLADRVLATDGIEGITLVGGEPFAQAEACAELCSAVRGRGLSVVVFSGYTLDELRRGPRAWVRLLSLADLLVDGRYERERPEPRRRWIGSANQVTHFLSERYSSDDPGFRQPNSVEIRLDREGNLQINGWPELAASFRPGGVDR